MSAPASVAPFPVTEARLDGPDALDRLIAAGQPAVLRGLVAEWPAVAAAARSPAALDAYLRPMDAGLPVPVMEAPAASAGRFGYAADPREYSFTRRQRPLAETLDRIARGLDRPGGPTIAIQMLPLASHLPPFVADNPMPLLPGVAPLLWLGGAVSTQIHNDRDHNLACVVAGRRRFLLFPPDAVGDLYVGPLDRPPPLSFVDPDAPDLQRFPRYAQALSRAQEAVLVPGDALVLPRHWWHHVRSLEPFNAMVNYWWGTRAQGLDDPHAAFLSALLALRGLPEAERRYWRAMLDHHVFGEGATHLPGPARGLLGDDAAARAQLRQRLRALALRS